MTAKRFYNLDGLRFFAAIFVVLGHAEIIKEKFGLPSFYQTPFFSNAGPIAVTFFFVLSGFLITYLLLIEKQQCQPGKRITIFRFYKNRMLRIWPLYYSLLLLIFFVFPFIPLFQYPGYDGSFPKNELTAFGYYLGFMPNYADHSFGNVLYFGQTWSLGVEEFFYLCFPVGLYLLPYKKLLPFFVALTAVSIAITGVSKNWCNGNDTGLSMLCIYISRYKIYAFAAGAIAAYGYLHAPEIKVVQTQKKLIGKMAILLFIMLLALVLSGTTFGMFTHLIYTVLFAGFLFGATVSNIKLYLLNNAMVVYAGKISYGIYMLHPLAIVLCVKLLYINTGNAIITTLLFSASTIMVTIIMAMISYTVIEKPFLYRKKPTLIQHINTTAN